MATVAPQEQKQGYWHTMVSDWSADKETFKLSWGKLMMWIFLLSDTFIFSIFLIGYMNVRMSTTDDWPLTTDRKMQK